MSDIAIDEKQAESIRGSEERRATSPETSGVASCSEADRTSPVR